MQKRDPFCLETLVIFMTSPSMARPRGNTMMKIGPKDIIKLVRMTPSHQLTRVKYSCFTAAFPFSLLAQKETPYIAGLVS